MAISYKSIWNDQVVYILEDDILLKLTPAITYLA